MQNNQHTFSRELIARVNNGLIDQRRPDVSKLPPRVSDSIRATEYPREQLTKAFANARHKVLAVG